MPINDYTTFDRTGFVTADTGRRVGFAAGQTRYFVVDLEAAMYAPGAYPVVGIFNTRQVLSALSVTQ